MKRIYKYLSPTVISKRTNDLLNQFWAGYIIYITCYTLIISGVVSAKLAYVQLLGMIVFLIAAVRLVRFRIQNKYLRTVYIVYCGWLFFLVVNGFSFSREYLFTTVIDAYGGIFLYLAPLILLFPKDLVYLKKVINVILILSVIFVACDLIFMKALLAPVSENGQTIIEYFSKILSIPTGFILLIIPYHKDKRKLWSLLGKLWVLAIVVLTLLLAAIRARRGLMFMSADILLFSYLIYNYAYKSSLFFRVAPLALLFFLFAYELREFSLNGPGKFSLITKRLKEDTRSAVVDYFYQDMTQRDWIVGKGINGMYYCPTGATEDGFRGVIETDYLQIILKGGIVSLCLLLLIAVPAVFLGLFYSKNILSKAAASWILLWLFALYPATVATFSLNYLLIWISIGICYSSKIRNMPEEILRRRFRYKIF